jgi:hypothetical protein
MDKSKDINIEFITWLEQQTYRRYYPGMSSSGKELYWYWVNEEYNDMGNWNWREIKEIYDRQ